MDKATVFTKTAKGITQVNQKSASLSKDLMKVLKLIDGKSNFGQLLEKSELDKNVLERALNTLTKDGFARIFADRRRDNLPAWAPRSPFDHYYRLSVNTRLGFAQDGKTIRVGDRVELATS